MQEAQSRGTCPEPDPACAPGTASYPCIYDPSDNPFQYYRAWRDNAAVMKDFGDFGKELAAGTLPAVSFVKPMGFRTEHPGGSSISDGEKFVSDVFGAVQASRFAKDTLVLVVPDESGGFFDHVPTPPVSAVDGKAYGPRIPLLALGAFARQGVVSHVQLEHASIVRFIEWNWLGATGQLQGRDAVVNNIGSLLDPARTGVAVPEQEQLTPSAAPRPGTPLRGRRGA
jgi:phospholipase C